MKRERTKYRLLLPIGEMGVSEVALSKAQYMELSKVVLRVRRGDMLPKEVLRGVTVGETHGIAVGCVDRVAHLTDKPIA